MIDYGEDHHLMWVISIDATGELRMYSNPQVRVRANDTFCTKCPMEEEYNAKALQGS
jgi:hypothetical protein